MVGIELHLAGGTRRCHDRDRGVLPLAADGQAAGPRPLFQMPVPCGQVWEASTYTDDPDTDDPDGHWPDEDSIDLVQRNTTTTTSARASPCSPPPTASSTGLHDSWRHAPRLPRPRQWLDDRVSPPRDQAPARGRAIGSRRASRSGGRRTAGRQAIRGRAPPLHPATGRQRGAYHLRRRPHRHPRRAEPVLPDGTASA